MELIERYQGSLLGLATGDALGAVVEFMHPGTFEPVTGMRSGGPHQLAAGQWTDDTSMALCLASSLIECQGFDPIDQLKRYVRWYREGYMSSTGGCFDIGNTTSVSLRDFERTGQPYRAVNVMTAGNGSLMRLVSVPLAYANDPIKAVQKAVDSSRTTHNAPGATSACAFATALLIGILNGESKEKLLSGVYQPVDGIWEQFPLSPEVQIIAEGSYLLREPPEIKAGFSAMGALEAALWAFSRSRDFPSGCLMAVNLGDDSDTVGAVYGMFAGAYYGVEAIPPSWRKQLYQSEMILGLADDLFELSKKLAE